MVLVMISLDGSPLLGLNAAELWNSQSKDRPSAKKQLFNSQLPRVQGSVTLYNPQSRILARNSHSGIKQNLEVFAKVDRSKQVPSKLWGLLSPQALANKQSDIDYALQKEYERKQATAVAMRASIRKNEAVKLQNARKHEALVAAYRAERQQLNSQGKSQTASAVDRGFSNRSGQQAFRKHSSSSSNRVSGSNVAPQAARSEPRDLTQTFKKPVRLYNSSR